MNYPSRQVICLLILLGIFMTRVNGQMIGQLTLLQDQKTILISVIPQQSIGAPQNITNTAQITLKAPAGSLTISNFQSITGIWSNSVVIRQPQESPNEDYFVFNLSTHLFNPSYQANIEVPLFSFENSKECTDQLQIIENFSDPFWPPNSVNANIGNQLTVLQYGINNAYEKNDPIRNKISCPDNIQFQVLINDIKCHGESGNFHFKLLAGDLPFHYQILSTNRPPIIDSLLSQEDSINIQLMSGDYQLIGETKKDSIHHYFKLVDPNPLSIEIVDQSKVPCNAESGGMVRLKGTGGKSMNDFSFEWSNGVIGHQLEELSVGNYRVTMTDSNKCTLSKEIIIASEIVPQIDSVQLQMPTCHNEPDGAIEMVEILHGVPPYIYALNNGKYQTAPYFKDLPAGTYQLSIQDSRTCVTEHSVILDNPPKIEIVSMPNDTILIYGESLVLNAQIIGSSNLNYSWSPEQYLSCNDCPSPTAFPNSNTTFDLIVSNDFGCEATFSQQVSVLKELPIYIPNVFSPNNDGENEVFQINTGPKIAYGRKLQIFSRWGQLVFEMNNNNENRVLYWDGTMFGQPAKSGVYLYVADILLENGESILKKGDILLVR